MSPVLVVSDTHFHACKPRSGLDHQVEAWRRAVEEGAARGCRLMLVAGDVFDLRGGIKPSVFNRVSRLVVETLAGGFDLGVIPGNVDWEEFDSGESAVDSWDYLKHRGGSGTTRCRVFHLPAVHKMGSHRVLGIPCMQDVESFRKTFRKWSVSALPDITFIHQGVDDFAAGNGRAPTGLTAQWLEDHNPGTIVCGHIHRPGQSRSGRVVNVGALVRHGFRDEGGERGCWVLTGSAAEFIRIESPGFVTLRGEGTLHPDCRGAFVRVVARTEEEAERLRKSAEDAGALSVAVEIEREFKTAHEKTVHMSSPREMLLEYLEIVDKYGDRREEIVRLFDRLCGG